MLATAQAFSQIKIKDDESYGDNLITVSPFYGYASPELSDVCLGLSYERFISDYVGVQVPINIGLINNLFQSGLAAKFYPFGNQRPVKYSIAPTLLYSMASREEITTTWDPISGTEFQTIVDEKTNQFGFMLTSALNITIQKQIYVGMATGLGMNYINRTKRDAAPTINEGPNVNFMFNISMGYRF